MSLRDEDLEYREAKIVEAAQRLADHLATEDGSPTYEILLGTLLEQVCERVSALRDYRTIRSYREAEAERRRKKR